MQVACKLANGNVYALNLTHLLVEFARWGTNSRVPQCIWSSAMPSINKIRLLWKFFSAIEELLTKVDCLSWHALFGFLFKDKFNLMYYYLGQFFCFSLLEIKMSDKEPLIDFLPNNWITLLMEVTTDIVKLP